MIVTLKKGNNRVTTFSVFVILIASFSLIAVAAGVNTSQESEVASSKNPLLANTVNENSINTPYIKQYLEAYDHFSDIRYEPVLPNSEAQATLTVGNREDNVKGFEINGKRYAVHLLFCDYNLQRCFFRINGVPTKALHALKAGQPETQSIFNLDNTYKIKVNSIIFDYCDNRRFCNLHYEAYDIANISVIPR